MKYFLPILFLSCSWVIKAQNWCPPGATWSYNAMTANGDVGRNLYWAGETIIDGITCQIVQDSDYGNPAFQSQPGIFYTYESGDTVYYWNDSMFLPFMYFNAKTGDTLGLLADGALHKAIVDSNGTEVINNDSLRYYYFHYVDISSSYQLQGLTVERLGLIYDAFNPMAGSCYDCDAYGGYYEQCYSDSFFPRYGYYGGCAAYSDVKKIQGQLSLTACPNPCTAYTLLNTNGYDAINSLQIMSITGQIIQTFKPQSATVPIETSGLSPGLYFIRVTDTQGRTATQKLVKQ